jgi:dTDP-4-dehydrorhamnose 3,5-epimerase-like enzyme
MEAFHEKKLIELGIQHRFVQDNLAGSHQGVLRGLHYQIKNAQGKLVQVLIGEIFDVAVDSDINQNVWKIHLYDAFRRKQMSIMDSAGVCTWLLRSKRVGGGCL